MHTGLRRGFVFILFALLGSTGFAEVRTDIRDVSNGTNGKLGALVRGLAESMSSAAQRLTDKGRRLEATEALDDARRIARLLSDVAPDHMRDSAELGLNSVQEARHALQTGDPEHASTILARAGDVLMERNRAINGAAAPVVDERLATGRRVVNAKGQKLGKISSFGADSAGHRCVILKKQGVINLFGFLDFDNQLVVVPVESLVVGSQLAAVATEATADQLVMSSRYDPRRPSHSSACT